MKSGNMLFDMTDEALCKVLCARVEFQKKNYTKALVIRFLRKNRTLEQAFMSLSVIITLRMETFRKDSFMF